MYANLEDWKNGWFGVELGLTSQEIDELIAQLRMIQNDPDQHFHLSNIQKGTGGIGDILFCIQSCGEDSNMDIGSKAHGPGEELD